jgi:signal transduction histidine kinase
LRKQVMKCFVVSFLALPLISGWAVAGEPPAQEKQDYLLEAAVFLSEPTVLPVDRALFKQLSVADNADLLPDAAAKYAAQNKIRAELTDGFVLALQQQQAEKEQQMRQEQVRRDRMHALRGASCDQPGVNYSECRAAVDRKIAAGAFPSLSQVLAEGDDSVLRVNVWGPSGAY